MGCCMGFERLAGMFTCLLCQLKSFPNHSEQIGLIAKRNVSQFLREWRKFFRCVGILPKEFLAYHTRVHVTSKGARNS